VPARDARGHEAAAEQRDLLLRHAERIEAQIATLHIHLDYLRAKAALWDARDRGDPDAQAKANLRVQDMYPRLEEVVLR
jgi:MerR family transcriptional regulator, copper efflux regulator